MIKLRLKRHPATFWQFEDTIRSIFIGRNSSNDVSLPEKTLSRNHATIVARNGAYILQAKATHNITKVNNKTVTSKRLETGDEIRLGKLVLIFERCDHVGGEPSESTNDEPGAIDFCRELLGIPEGKWPPTYYQLLGVQDFESDAEVIDRASKDRTRELRKRELDPRYAENIQQLLNEVALARATLLNPERRAKYDRELRELLGEPPSPPSDEPPSRAQEIDQTTEESRPRDVPAHSPSKSLICQPIHASFRGPSLPGGGTAAAKRPPQRSKMPLFVGSVAAVLVTGFLGVSIFIANSGRDKADTSGSKAQKIRKMSPEKRRRKAESLYTTDKASFESEDYDTAVSKLQEFTERFPNSEHLGEVEKMLRKATVKRDSRKMYEKQAKKLYNEGKASLEREAYEEAIEKLSRVTTEHSNSPVFSQAQGLLRKANALYAEKLYSAGREAYREERYPDAIKTFEQLIKRYPESKWFSDAHDRLETLNKTVIERIASDAWVVYEEYNKLNQAGWLSDENRNFEEIVHDTKEWSWAIGRSAGRLSKDEVRLKLVELKSVDQICYLSEQAKKQIGNKVLAEGEWLTPEQAKERGMTKLRGQWYTWKGLLKQQVMIARINARKLFAVRRCDLFDKELADFHGNFWFILKQKLTPGRDRREPLGIPHVGVVQALHDFAYNKVESFQPGSDRVGEENRWIAAKATVVVSYNLKVSVYEFERPPGTLLAKKYMRKDAKNKTAQKKFICLLIQEGKAIRRFLDSKKGAGELIFDKGIYEIPRLNRDKHSISRLYQQSIFFENHTCGIVIAVIYEPEFNEVFNALNICMSGP